MENYGTRTVYWSIVFVGSRTVPSWYYRDDTFRYGVFVRVIIVATDLLAVYVYHGTRVLAHYPAPLRVCSVLLGKLRTSFASVTG